MLSLFSSDLPPMPDQALSMFQLDRPRLVDEILSRPTHCGEISLCLREGWEPNTHFGKLQKTDSGDILDLDPRQRFAEHRCSWQHASTKCNLDLYSFAPENLENADYILAKVLEAALKRGEWRDFKVIESGERELRPEESKLIKGRTPTKLCFSTFQLSNDAEEKNIRIINAIYNSHAQKNTYVLSATSEIPVVQPLKVLRLISYSMAHFWILPRQFASANKVA